MNTPVYLLFFFKIKNFLVLIESYMEGEFLLMFLHDIALYIIFFYVIMILVYVILVPHMV